MSLDKAISSKKEHRKPYYDSRRFDTTCRCHGSCGYCRNNRLIRQRKESQRLESIEVDYEQGV